MSQTIGRIDEFTWRRVLEFANGRDIVTTTDMVTRFNIHAATAKKYMGLLVESHGWQLVKGVRRPGSRGPAARAIARAGLNIKTLEKLR